MGEEAIIVFMHVQYFFNCLRLFFQTQVLILHSFVKQSCSSSHACVDFYSYSSV